MDFSKLPYTYWSDITKISYLQRRIIVYSLMYYEMSESCVSDRDYDILSYKLVELQNIINEEDFKKTQYYYAMYDYDGSTGFDIPSRLNANDTEYLTNIASHIYHGWHNRSD